MSRIIIKLIFLMIAFLGVFLFIQAVEPVFIPRVKKVIYFQDIDTPASSEIFRNPKFYIGLGLVILSSSVILSSKSQKLSNTEN